EAFVFVLHAHFLEAVLGLSGDWNEAVSGLDERTDQARRAILNVGTVEMTVDRDGVRHDLLGDALVPLATHLHVLPGAAGIQRRTEAIVTILVDGGSSDTPDLDNLAGRGWDVL